MSWVHDHYQYSYDIVLGYMQQMFGVCYYKVTLLFVLCSATLSSAKFAHFMENSMSNSSTLHDFYGLECQLCACANGSL